MQSPEPAENAAVSKATFLYRHFDEEMNLLYVGISLNAVNRLAQHREASGWFAQIRSVTVEAFNSRDEALEAERIAIKKEKPKFNVMHNLPEPEGIFDVARTDLMRKVFFKPVYNFKEVAEHLGMSIGQIKRMIDVGTLGCLTIGKKRFVTGWQLIDFIELWESYGDLPTSQILRQMTQAAKKKQPTLSPASTGDK